jgi:ABC-type amino acid transport substrate-binding protein
MHTIAVALLGTCAVAGLVRWRTGALIRYVSVTVVLVIAVIGGMRILAADVLGIGRHAGDALAAMRLDQRADAVVLSAPPVAIAPAPGGRMEAILARQTLRVCHLSDALPFAFVNGRRELVGFDVAAMHRLAVDVGAHLEFLPVDREELDHPAGLTTRLRDGQCDIGIGGIAVTPARARLMRLSSSYLSETVAFVVRDETERRFESWDRIRSSGSLTIAVPDVQYYVDYLHRRVPNARLQKVSSVEALFALPAMDAIALPAERGSAWTLRYPQYAVVVPAPKPIQIPLVFVLPPAEPQLADALDTWINLKRSDVTLDELYQYWILGQDRAARAPRWSVIRDVLRWVP